MAPSDIKVPKSDDGYEFPAKIKRYFCGHSFLFWFSFVASILTVITFFGCVIDCVFPTVMVDGQVYMDGHPCPNATIVCDGSSVTSNLDGTFVLYVKKGKKSVCVTKNGINQTSQTLDANGQVEKMVILMVRQDPYTE